MAVVRQVYPVVMPMYISDAREFVFDVVGSSGDLVNYAGVAGDANPIHWDEKFAKMIDLENVLAHGMLTMGVGGGFISEWLGDPGAVKDYTVRFTTPIPVDTHKPAEIVFGGKIKSKDEESRTAVISIGATFEGKRIFGHRATATVQLG